jgi:hypothetical protein
MTKVHAKPRHARRAWMCLALGLLASVGIAWTLALAIPIPMYPREVVRCFVAGDQAWDVVEIHKFGATDAWWDRIDEGSADLETRAADIRAQAGAHVPGRPDLRVFSSPPWWGSMRHPGATTPDIGSDTAFGWPMRCAWYQVTGKLSQNAAGNWLVDRDELHGGLLITGELSSRGHDFRALPLRPIFRGLAVDALSFGSLIWLVLFGWPSFRRRNRIRRGLCPSCAYDLRAEFTKPCPECGRTA